MGAIRFLMDGEVREIAGADPTMTVLQWLRGPARRTGTKEGCAEGDCGACTVLLGDLVDDHVAYRPVNACILFVPALNGRELVTVESLSKNGALHPAQQAMVDHHGSQCGFCTPGFVMSLAALYEPGASPDDATINDALAGNLCRCTGYAPIVAAAKAMGGLPAASRPNTTAALKDLQREDPLELDFIDSFGGVRRTFEAPRSSDALAKAFEARPDAVLTAGCTDVGLWVTRQRRSLGHTISLAEAADLKSIVETDKAITFGAAVTHAEALPYLRGLHPDVGEVLRRLGSAQVRNSGTLVANIGNGSPIGDTPPLLIALGATLTLRRGEARRDLPLEAYFLDYGKQDRQPGEFIESVTVNRLPPGDVYAAYKLTKRFDQDISAVCAAFRFRIQGGHLADVRAAFGGMADIPKRAAACEAALVGQSWTEATIRAAMTALEADFTPLSDHRASATYRLATAKNLLLKAWLESGGELLRLVGQGSLADG